MEEASNDENGKMLFSVEVVVLYSIIISKQYVMLACLFFKFLQYSELLETIIHEKKMNLKFFLSLVDNYV